MRRIKRKTKNKVKKTRKIRSLYSRENLILAVKEAHEGKCISELSRKYQVPESTIRSRKMGKCADKKPGPATVLTAEEEIELVKWIFHCSKQGFPVTKYQLIDSVQMICNFKNMKTIFTENKPGRAWFEGFLKRHPTLSQRISENVSVSRAAVSELKIRCWFTEIKDYLCKENLLEIEPGRIFNADETGVPLNPKPPPVLAPKGCKNVYNIVDNNEKENVTVLITGNAAGELAPPLVLFAGKSLPKNIVKVAPPEYGFGFSDNGWMTAKNFYEYIANVFHPWLEKNSVQRPVILYIDGHSSHITLPLSKFCQEKQIVLIALYPNSTHILQPLDVSFFRTFKSNWQKTWKGFCDQSASISIKKSQFPSVLKKTLDTLKVKEILPNGFKTCGLYPLNADAVDFTKVFKKIETPSCQSDNNTENQCKLSAGEGILQLVEKELDPDLLELFKNNNENTNWTGSIEDTSLFEFWLKLKNALIVDKDTSKHDTEKLDDLLSQNTSCRSPDLEVENAQIMDIQQDLLLQDQEILNHEEGIIIDMMLDPDTKISDEELRNILVVQDTKQIRTEQFVTNSYNTQDPIPESDSEINNLSKLTSKSQFLDQTLQPILNLNKEIQPAPSETNRIIINESVILNLTNSNPTIQSNSSLSETQEMPSETAEENNHFTNPGVDVQSCTNQIIISQALSKPVEEFSKSPVIPDQIVEKSSEVPSNALKNITNNKTDANISKYPINYEELLHYPKVDVTVQKRKRASNAIKLPSVLSTPQWQNIAQEKEDVKLQKIEEIVLKKKIRLEKQEKTKADKENKRIKREEQKVAKEQIRLQKEKEKFLKQQQKIENLEAKKLANEELLSKNREAVELRKKIEELQAREAELSKEKKLP